MCSKTLKPEMTAVGFEPTQLALVELESTPLDHSGKLSVPDPGCRFVKRANCALRFSDPIRNTTKKPKPKGVIVIDKCDNELRVSRNPLGFACWSPIS